MTVLQRQTLVQQQTGTELASLLKVACVIPAYRASGTIAKVIDDALAYADRIIVVDDGCPEGSGEVARRSFAGNPAVTIIHRESNGGVGAAVKTGIGVALDGVADIIVKIDADGQMDPSYIANIRAIFERDPTVVCIKGNRFFDSTVIELMPKTRLFGNAVLSIFAKAASGYWNVLDPTNGYLAFNAPLLKVLPWQSFADSYFFEISVLCELGLKRLPIVELEMPTIYTEAPSSLAIGRVLLEFPFRLLSRALRRLVVQYFVFDINLGTLYAVFGTLLLLFGLVFGGYEWIQSLVTHVGRATGTVMLAVLPFLMGFQLLLNALMYDVQFSEKTHHELLVTSRRRTSAFGTAAGQREEYRTNRRDSV